MNNPPLPISYIHMSYFFPKSESDARIEVKGSRFIGRLYPVENQLEAKKMLRQIKDKYKDATHNCWAFRVSISRGDFEARSSDEGEPSGTAGRPILECLEERQIGDALLVVSRYFGGTKLGLGGLNRAYRRCAREVIARSQLEEKPETAAFNLRFPYDYEPMMRNHLYRNDGQIDFSHYGDDVVWKVSFPEISAEKFLQGAGDICRGELEIRSIEED